MRKKERHQLILQELQIRPHVRVATLAQRFDVATETIRRDLDALSAEGLIDREFGGASARPMGHQPPAEERGQTIIAERARIGAAACAIILPGEVVMVDAGSTVSQLARFLRPGAQPRTFITNCYSVVRNMGDQARSDHVILCPGRYDPQENAVYGTDTVEYLRRFQANKAFIGASGLSRQGPSDVNRDAVWVKRAMMERSGEVWLMIDHTKFDQRFLEIVTPLDVLTGIISDQLPPPALLAQLDRSNVRVVVAEGQDNGLVAI
ncbi:DeoR/GlpR family DNA-binding transcription regulator [Thalassospira sp.]|uniref:DeoR/GlpR family DNA-binding transcription regulator n=1 Tax=Thalassospira sp. TaxID=1912094 RepID=UPI002734C04F|nr:DeoR/GlpR family DNA-binding transcription regulator [Thalassospira sp.]MDP2699660.1 DeoR/GlpR family DNA-binding transcription regulator [Thalassospira sp.]